MTTSEHIRAHLTRAQRHELKRLAHKVDKIVLADKKFFERHPHRMHRIRAAGRGEFEHVALAIGNAAMPLAPGVVYFTAIRNVRPGWRIRAFFHGSWSLDVDELSEEAAESVFRQLRTDEMMETERAIAEGTWP
jgi:hypothetical protein